jgi:hypothetical protein
MAGEGGSLGELVKLAMYGQDKRRIRVGVVTFWIDRQGNVCYDRAFESISAEDRDAMTTALGEMAHRGLMRARRAAGVE